MRDHFILFVLVFAVAISGCNRKQAAQESTPSATVSSDTATGSSTEKQAARNLVVSFISKGSGINREAFKAFDSYISDFNEKHQPAIAFSIKSWGREGEKDFCIDMNNPNFELFYKGAQKLLADRELVSLKKGADCRQ